jgi:glycosyltransferase involved in cell wall biosynthesis
MFSNGPLISAIMPTRGRPEFALRALECFRAQTWRQKELVILDDSMDPSFPRGAPNGTRYYRIEGKQTVGSKRNIAVSRASGSLICHWDDDDWSAPERIAEQAARLMAKPEYQITGYYRMLFTDGSDWWQYEAPDWYALGTSLMYTVEAWRARPFTAEQIGEDLSFILNRRVLTADAGDRMVAWVHDGNTAEKRNEAKKAPKQWIYLGEVA